MNTKTNIIIPGKNDIKGREIRVGDKYLIGNDIVLVSRLKESFMLIDIKRGSVISIGEESFIRKILRDGNARLIKEMTVKLNKVED